MINKLNNLKKIIIFFEFLDKIFEIKFLEIILNEIQNILWSSTKNIRNYSIIISFFNEDQLISF